MNLSSFFPSVKGEHKCLPLLLTLHSLGSSVPCAVPHTPGIQRGQTPSVSAPMEFSSLGDRERPHMHYGCGEDEEGTAPHGAEAGRGHFGELSEPPQRKDVEVTLDSGLSVRLQAEGKSVCENSRRRREGCVLFTTR